MTTPSRWRRAGLGAALSIAVQAGGSALAAPLSTGSDALKILFSGGVDPSTGLPSGSPALKATFPSGQQGTCIMDTGSAGMVVYNTPFTPQQAQLPPTPK
jgi:hypothetical protein